MKTLIRGLLVAAGILCVALGVIGIFLPLVPTTPLLLLAAACFVRSSDRLYNRLLATRVLGGMIRDYREGRRMPLGARIVTIAVLWLTIGASFYFAVRATWLRVLLVLIASGVTVFLLSMKGRGKKGAKDRGDVRAPALLFTEVKEEAQIDRVAALAGRIWREYFTPIIGSAQVEYMLEKFQSFEAVRNQIRREGFHYYLVREPAGDYIGYLGFTGREGTLFLSKLYFIRERRGRGCAREAVKFLEAVSRESGCSRIVLTVNRHNQNAIRAYEKMGFVRTGESVRDIGDGFVMDDYHMEKTLSRTQP